MSFKKWRVTWNNVLSPFDWWIIGPGEKSDDMTGSPCPDRELVHLKYFIKNMLPFESVILLTGTKIKNILVNSNQLKNWGFANSFRFSDHSCKSKA